VLVRFFESKEETARRMSPAILEVEIERREGDVFHGWTDEGDEGWKPISFLACNIDMAI